MKPAAVAALAAALLILANCGRHKPAAAPPRLTLAPASFAALTGWDKDGIAAALGAFQKSCAAFAGRRPTTPIGPGGIAGTVGDWRAPCRAAAALTPDSDTAARRFFQAFFTPYAVGNNGKPDGLFTGYYEPELKGARAPDGRYRVPLLKRPPDLVTVDLGRFREAWHGEHIVGRLEKGRLEPFPTRATIERGALDHEKLALLWVDSAVDAFFLEIQGSGRVKLADGTVVRVGYDAQNGRTYVPIGRLLLQRGDLQKGHVSLQSIRAWLHAHPDAAGKLMDENPSYVFFRELLGNGPIGAESVVLTSGRSLAVDPHFMPLGVPVWLQAQQSGTAVDRLMVAQDTGGAIRGPVRGDFFWGFGPLAEQRAGGMSATGRYYLLLPKSVAPRLSQAGGGQRLLRNFHDYIAAAW